VSSSEGKEERSSSKRLRNWLLCVCKMLQKRETIYNVTPSHSQERKIGTASRHSSMNPHSHRVRSADDRSAVLCLRWPGQPRVSFYIVKLVGRGFRSRFLRRASSAIISQPGDEICEPVERPRERRRSSIRETCVPCHCGSYIQIQSQQSLRYLGKRFSELMLRQTNHHSINRRTSEPIQV